MKKGCFIFLMFVASACYSQTERKFDFLLSAQYNHTLQDQYPFYKTGIAGLGFQVFYSLKNQLRPTLEVNADLFKEEGIGAADAPTYENHLRPSVCVGLSYYPVDRFFIAAAAGPHFFENTHLGVKSSLGYYLGKKVLIRTSYTNVFQGEGNLNKDLGYLSFALAFKL